MADLTADGKQTMGQYLIGLTPKIDELYAERLQARKDAINNNPEIPVAMRAELIKGQEYDCKTNKQWAIHSIIISAYAEINYYNGLHPEDVQYSDSVVEGINVIETLRNIAQKYPISMAVSSKNECFAEIAKYLYTGIDLLEKM